MLKLIGAFTFLAASAWAGLTVDRNIEADLIEGQASVRNFIRNSGAEQNIRGWATYADAAGATPVDGTGGSPTETFARSTTSPLAGIASFVLTKDAANRQGEGASYAFNLDPADSTNGSQNLLIDFYYSTGGTFATGTSSDVQVYVYDITNANLITPNQTYLNSSSGRFQTTFLSSSSSTNYRLIFHTATTSASAWTLKIDRVNVKQIGTTVAVSGASTIATLTTGNGFGSTNTNVRRYSSVTVQGNGLTCADDATNGASCTVNEDGIWGVTRVDRNTGAAATFGVSKNDACSSGFNSVAASDKVVVAQSSSNVAANGSHPGISLTIGDVIRACDDSGNKTNETSDQHSRLIISKVKEAALPSAYIVATGGTITTDGNFRVHTFTSSGTFQITAGTGTVESLVIAGGGGGGGGNYGGGGGGGGYIHTTPGSIYGVGSYTVTVGAGGTGGNAAGTVLATNGGTSAFDAISTVGGGAGGYGDNISGNYNGSNGGSGGGGAGRSGDTTGGTGTAGQGFAGGIGGVPSTGLGGGGGGATAVGANYSSGGGGVAGAGGAGGTSAINGSSVCRGGGGGGGSNGATSGTATCGGGAGNSGGNGTSATANTGGGGGGAGGPTTYSGGNGGSGVVILRYQFQ